MDGIQLLLIIIIVSLTSLLLVVGIQVFFVVKEIRAVVKRLSGMLDNSTDRVTTFLETLKKKQSN